MKQSSPAITLGLLIAFLAGFVSHFLYQRWNPSPPAIVPNPTNEKDSELRLGIELPSFRVTFQPTPPIKVQPDIPLVQAREVEKIRRLAGNQARIRGRVFRVGHSAKSNTYFLNFGPSREALTPGIFSMLAGPFEKKKLQPKTIQGKKVEIQGEIKEHPQYRIELNLDNTEQIKMLD